MSGVSVQDIGMQDFAAARRAMVESQLRPEGVVDVVVVNALAKLPRENFVPASARAFAYGDRPVALGNGRALSPPAVVGRLLSELEPRPGERALVVGAGSGYSAAVLDKLGLIVTALESDPTLASMARTTAPTLDVVEGDLAAGHRAGAPYDLILIDGAVEHVPEAITSQLVEGGRIGTVLSDRGVTRLAVGRSVGGRVGLRTIADAEVAPLPGFERPRAFTF
jgi:protein-L-isoaspartate(D-aspartate) O-methyltransferase